MKQLTVRIRAWGKKKGQEWETIFYTLGPGRSVLTLLKAVWPIMAVAVGYALGFGVLLGLLATAVLITLKTGLQRDALSKRVLDLELEILSRTHAAKPHETVPDRDHHRPHAA